MVGLSPRPSRSVLGSSGAASENGLRGNPEGHGWPSARTPAARLRWHCAPARWAKDRTGRRSGDKIRGQLLPDPPRLRASLRALHRLLLPPERGKVAPKATEGGGHSRRWSRPPPPPAEGWSPSPLSQGRTAAALARQVSRLNLACVVRAAAVPAPNGRARWLRHKPIAPRRCGRGASAGRPAPPAAGSNP